MSSFKKRYDEKVKRDALGMLKNLYLRIYHDELKVTNSGFWKAGINDSYIFRVDVDEAQSSEVLDKD